MAIVPIFQGHVDEQARLGLLEAERDRRRVWLSALAGQDVEVIVRKRRTQRSLDQQAYLHAVSFHLLADFWGEDIETTKLLALGYCFGFREIDGYRFPIKPSTSGLTVDETSHLIDWLPPWAMTKFNVEIPLPEKVATS